MRGALGACFAASLARPEKENVSMQATQTRVVVVSSFLYLWVDGVGERVALEHLVFAGHHSLLGKASESQVSHMCESHPWCPPVGQESVD